MGKNSWSLKDRIAVVTGASRGGGRTIAGVLGSAGATVYVTGRSVEGSTTEGLPGTVQATARDVTSRGGRGVAMRCDHTNEAEVKALFSQIARDHGRLDLLVNNAWGGYEEYDGRTFDRPFWEQPHEKRWRGMFEAGVQTHLLTSRYAVSLMIPQRKGLIISTVAWAFDEYLGNLYYDVAKSAIIRMVFGMSKELKGHGISVVALAPGFMRTERVMASHAKEPFPLDETESPEYLGRAVAALASDPSVSRRSGRLFTVGELAREYDFTDTDGTQPEAFRFKTESG